MCVDSTDPFSTLSRANELTGTTFSTLSRAAAAAVKHTTRTPFHTELRRRSFSARRDRFTGTGTVLYSTAPSSEGPGGSRLRGVQRRSRGSRGSRGSREGPERVQRVVQRVQGSSWTPPGPPEGPGLDPQTRDLCTRSRKTEHRYTARPRPWFQIKIIINNWIRLASAPAPSGLIG